MTAAAEVVVIGAGQSGLAAARALRARGMSPVVLEAGDRAAGSWPRYYDSLKAFSPARFNFMPGMAFALAASTLVGQGLGAGKPDLAEKFGWETQRFGRLFGGLTGVGFIVLAPYIMRLYTNDAAVIDAGSNALRIIGLIQTFLDGNSVGGFMLN